ncbi:MAG: BamA/TamA family outer membrane protein [Bacteroidota bacterium]
MFSGTNRSYPVFDINEEKNILKKAILRRTRDAHRHAIRWVMLSGLAFTSTPGMAQEGDSTHLADSSPVTDSVPPAGTSGSGTFTKHKNGFLALPVVYYRPETKLAFGGVGIYYFRPPNSLPETRASSIRAGLIYTTASQIIAKIEPQVFLEDEKYFVSGDVSFFKFPDKFYGIGNSTPSAAEEDYVPQIFRFRAGFEYQFLPRLFGGILYNFYNYRILEYAEGGELMQGTIPGSGGGKLSGVGLSLKWDTRDNVFDASRGAYFLVTAVTFQRFLGSEFSYTNYKLDLRKYFSIIPGQHLAIQFYGGFMAGEPPFQFLQRLGGEKLMRGYREGRYSDRNYMLLQGEYRLHVYWRFGAVVFAGIGDVSSRIGNFRLPEFKPTYGFGFRFAVSEEERLNIRLDFGFGQPGNSGFYLTASEAF